MKIKFFKNLIRRHNKNTTPNLVSGFTIVEAMVAIFILTVSVSSMLAITASSASSARYANNELTANYLLQEAVDSIRNSRDTLAFKMKDDLKGDWSNFLKRYGSNGNNECFSPNGCYLEIDKFDPTDKNGRDIQKCNEKDNSCPYLKYDDTATNLFYNYTSDVESPFKRTVNMKKINDDEVEVTAKVEWLNGDATVERTQTLTIYLLNWQK